MATFAFRRCVRSGPMRTSGGSLLSVEAYGWVDLAFDCFRRSVSASSAIWKTQTPRLRGELSMRNTSERGGGRRRSSAMGLQARDWDQGTCRAGAHRAVLNFVRVKMVKAYWLRRSDRIRRWRRIRAWRSTAQAANGTRQNFASTDTGDGSGCRDGNSVLGAALQRARCATDVRRRRVACENRSRSDSRGAH